MRTLRPAIRKNKKLHVGQPSDSHATLAARLKLDDVKDSEHGFTPDGKLFLSRKQSVEWLKNFDPVAHGKVAKAATKEGLHSGDYARAKGIRQKTLREPEPKPEVVTPEPPAGKPPAGAGVNLKEKTIFIHDSGNYTHLAEYFSRYFGKVLYYVPNSDGAYPLPIRDRIGTGLDGVERVLSLWDYVDPDSEEQKRDWVFCFPDVGHGDVQEILRALGFAVFGSLGAEILEQDKWIFNQVLKKVGLPTAPLVKIKGLTKLKKYLEDKTDKYIKVSFYRGIFETYHFVDYSDSQPWFDDVETRLGSDKEEQEFLVQDSIPSKLEIGRDGFNLDGECPLPCVVGLELKDTGYFGAFVGELPPIFQYVEDKLKPIFKKYGYQGVYATEYRITDEKFMDEFKGKPYYIDLTARCPSPPGEALPEAYKNFARIVWDIAHGIMPESEQAKKYVVQIILTSAWLADRHSIKISFPESDKRWVRLKNYHIKKNGNDSEYWVDYNDNGGFIGSVIAIGDDPEATCALALQRASRVKGEQIEYKENVFEKIQEGLNKAKAMGIDL